MTNHVWKYNWQSVLLLAKVWHNFTNSGKHFFSKTRVRIFSFFFNSHRYGVMLNLGFLSRGARVSEWERERSKDGFIELCGAGQFSTPRVSAPAGAKPCSGDRLHVHEDLCEFFLSCDYFFIGFWWIVNCKVCLKNIFTFRDARIEFF